MNKFTKCHQRKFALITLLFLLNSKLEIVLSKVKSLFCSLFKASGPFCCVSVTRSKGSLLFWVSSEGSNSTKITLRLKECSRQVRAVAFCSFFVSDCYCSIINNWLTCRWNSTLDANTALLLLRPLLTADHHLALINSMLRQLHATIIFKFPSLSLNTWSTCHVLFSLSCSNNHHWLI